MSNNQRSPLGVFISCSHRRLSQNKSERIQVAMAYTSASTALNQKLSEKQKASAPITALPKNAKASLVVSIALKAGNFLSRRVKVQNKNRIVKALEKTDIKFTSKAICSGPLANKEKKAPII